jgi:hypothetical protein
MTRSMSISTSPLATFQTVYVFFVVVANVRFLAEAPSSAAGRLQSVDWLLVSSSLCVKHGNDRMLVKTRKCPFSWHKKYFFPKDVACRKYNQTTSGLIPRLPDAFSRFDSGTRTSCRKFDITKFVPSSEIFFARPKNQYSKNKMAPEANRTSRALYLSSISTRKYITQATTANNTGSMNL